MEKESCMTTCAHFGFTDPAPPYTWGSNHFCKLHNKRIKKPNGKCKDLVDRLKKNGIVQIPESGDWADEIVRLQRKSA
jgi:hypothetical protein